MPMRPRDCDLLEMSDRPACLNCHGQPSTFGALDGLCEECRACRDEFPRLFAARASIEHRKRRAARLAVASSSPGKVVRRRTRA
jgi:hypothetical protein